VYVLCQELTLDSGNVSGGFLDDKEVLEIMASDTKISQELIDKLNMVQEFLDALNSGKQQYRGRIALMINTLDDVIKELKTIQERK